MIEQFGHGDNLRLFFARIIVILSPMAVAKLQVKEIKLSTVAEYLEKERKAFERSEYVDGEVYLMPTESGEHADISVNIVGELHIQLKGTECRARTKETKVKSGGAARAGKSLKGMFSYPDILVVCGEVKYHDKHKDIVLNPKVVIEVLSKSTETFNRNEKFTRYRMFNDTLTDYILVSQSKPMIERFVRQEDNTWKLHTYIGLENVCPIESIRCKLSLADVYDRVEFSKQAVKFLQEIAKLK